MIKKIAFILFVAQHALGQSYAPPAGQSGSTAIHKDSSIIIDWATNATIIRGYQNIADQSLGVATYGDSTAVPGVADGSNVVSLGDGGVAIVTFSTPITNGAGPDFAVFENSFSETFLELAFVEVSSDGVNYYRFPAVSETQTATQIGGFGAVDCRYIHNLAGKYKSQYGTPFDLDELIDPFGLDMNAITHVKIIDVVGSIDAQYGTQDHLGNMINDPFPTPFASSGFDLDAIGVIHQATQGVNEIQENVVSIYPNPTKGKVVIQSEIQGKYILFDSMGRTVAQGEVIENVISDISEENNGVYLLKVISEDGISVQRIMKR